MRAADLAEQIPTVTSDMTGAEAARVVAEYRLSGIVVADRAGHPVAVIPGSQLLALVLPRYVLDDPTLAHVYDEGAADELCEKLNRTTVGELIEAHRLSPERLPTVLPEDTLVEIAAVMVRGHYPLILVRDQDGAVHGVVTLSRTLAAIAARAGHETPLVRHRLERDLVHRGDDLAARLTADPAGTDDPEPAP